MRVSPFVLAFAVSSVLAAQPAASPPSPVPPGTPPGTPPVIQDELVITASLAPEEADRLPVAVDRIDAPEIERRSNGDALDLLRTVSGLAVVQSGSPGKLTSVFTRGAASAQTLVVWNGVELNDPAFGGFDWALLSTDGLERIEVVRGPFSAVWGSAAMGGVVQLVTRRGGEPRAGLVVEGGSHDLARASGDAHALWGPLAFDFAGHLRRGEGELDNDGYDGDELDLRAELEPTDSSRVGLLVRRNEAEIGLPFDFFGLPAAERRQRFDSTTVALPAGWQGERFGLDASLARIDSEVELEDPNDPFAASTTDARRDSLRVVGRRSLEGIGWIAFGGEGERERATSSSAFGPGLDDERADSHALFAQLGAARGRFSAEVGVRRDEHDAFGGATSARGGVVIRAHERLLVRASAGESFRAPSLGDLYFPGFSNPELDAERGRSYEVGLEATWGAARLGVVAYENEFRDLIQFDFVSSAPQNIGRARARGLETSLALRWRELDLRAAASWLDSEDLDTGAPLPRRPESSAHLVAAYERDRFGVHGALVQVGRREDVGGVELPSHTVVDLGGSFAWRAWLTPYARVENLLDREYEEAAGFPAPGRTWSLGLRLRSRP
jgi:vitamin B12 transporter